MKLVSALTLSVIFASGVFAQHRSFGVVRFNSPKLGPYGDATGFGRVAYPGTGRPPAAAVFGTPFSITDPTFASRLGNTVSGISSNQGFRRYRHQSVVPFAYPVFVGGYGDYGYGGNGYPPDQPQPDPAMMNPAPPSPQVVINQNFIPERASPVMHDYTGESGDIHVYAAPGREPAADQQEENTNYYLLAFKDHTIYSAFAYWVEGDTLHYVTPQRVHNQVSLNLVDRELTEKLNRGHNMQVKLPN